MNEHNERTKQRNEEARDADVIFGRNPVLEAIKSGRPLDRLLVARGEHGGSVPQIVALAVQAGVPVKDVDRKKLDFLCGHGNHQGVAAVGEPPFFVICDEIEDPHNLGAIIRTAEAAGAHGMIVPKRRSAPLSGVVAKTSAGAVEFLPIARVANLTQTIAQLKERGVWVYCADMDGEPYDRANLTGPIALVVGSEGSGVGRLVKETCDGVLSLPMKGRINSLNASVAAGILLYEIARRRD